jgi:hypothetical protein
VSEEPNFGQQLVYRGGAGPSDPAGERTLRRLVLALNVLVFLAPLLIGIFIGYAVLR